MEPGTLFGFNDPREILIKVFQDKKDRNPAYSIRAWAKQLGFKNPSYLSEVLRDKTPLKPELALRISKSLDVPEEERRYFEALVFHANAASDAEREFYTATIKRYCPEKELKTLGESYYLAAKSWLNLLADEMTLLKDFREDYTYLAKRVGSDVTPQMIEIVMKDMEETGLLDRDPRGRLVKKQINILPPRKTAADERAHYEKFGKKVWERATSARLSQTTEETYFRSSGFPVRRQDIPALREAFLHNVLELRKKFEPKQGTADEVYLLDVRFFKATLGEPEPPPKGGRK